MSTTTKNNNTGDFFARLRNLRGDKSQREFAAELGIPSQQTYANYEKDRMPKSDLIQRISQHCDVRMEWLLNGESPKFVSAGEAIKNQDYQAAFESLLLTMPKEDLNERLHDLLESALTGDTKAMATIRAAFDVMQAGGLDDKHP